MVYRVKESDVWKEITYINEEAFLGAIDIGYIELDIDFLDTEWGFCVPEEDVTVLGLTDEFDSYHMFRTVLAHELIHAYQIQEKLSVNHGNLFLSLADICNKSLDLSIQIEATH
jgi:hypothetical protein